MNDNNKTAVSAWADLFATDLPAPVVNPSKPCLCCGRFPQAVIREEAVCNSCAFWIDQKAAEKAE
jgi:hypothetical protein